MQQFVASCTLSHRCIFHKYINLFGFTFCCISLHEFVALHMTQFYSIHLPLAKVHSLHGSQKRCYRVFYEQWSIKKVASYQVQFPCINSFTTSTKAKTTTIKIISKRNTHLAIRSHYFHWNWIKDLNSKKVYVVLMASVCVRKLLTVHPHLQTCHAQAHWFIHSKWPNTIFYARDHKKRMQHFYTK